VSRAAYSGEQLARLRDLLAAIVPANPFYTSKFAANGFDATITSLDDFKQRAPFTFKHELIDDQLGHPVFGTNLTYPLDRYTRFNQTSATTGKPMRWLDTPESWDWMLGNWQRVFEAAGVTARDRIFFAFSFGPFLGFWTAFDSAARMGCLCIPGGGMRSSARLRVMIDMKATVLCCTPTYALHLAEAAEAEGIDLVAAHVRTVIVAGEPGGSIPGTRRLIEKLWNGARVVDHHGMTEVGPVSYGCPKREDVLHIIESGYLAEVIDPKTAEAVTPGTDGELVLTTLGRLGSPLVRYRTGDIVEQDPEECCECGSHDMALLGGIRGRTDDMVVVRGVNVYPGAVENVLRSNGGVAEYRVEIGHHGALSELMIQVEPEPAHAEDAGLSHHLEAALRDALALRIAVKIVPCGSLPRFELKAKRWVRL
jgi:phenylacetate-CoA ligase